MKCIECGSHIELIHSKKDGKYYNYWNCEDCGKVRPDLGTTRVITITQKAEPAEGKGNFLIKLPPNLEVDYRRIK